MTNIKETKPVIVAVDGPAGSGKSSVCVEACKKLGFTYVNTGFLYRSVALIAQRENVDFSSDQELCKIAAKFTDGLTWNPEEGKVIFNGENISEYLYKDEIGKLASNVATSPEIRKELLPVQRKLALLTKKGAIIDGRDIATVVFPDADVKVFMTASIDERARRRITQLHGKKADLTGEEYKKIKESIALRDKQDSTRKVAPLIQAKDATLLDTSDMNITESILSLIKIIETTVEA